jgi:hypothetical protein
VTEHASHPDGQRGQGAEPAATEADALEQAQPATAEEEAPVGPLDAEVPEADALEQARSAGGGSESPDAPHLGREVPEADALEQAQPSPLDDEEHEGPPEYE